MRIMIFESDDIDLNKTRHLQKYGLSYQSYKFASSIHSTRSKYMNSNISGGLRGSGLCALIEVSLLHAMYKIIMYNGIIIIERINVV